MIKMINIRELLSNIFEQPRGDLGELPSLTFDFSDYETLTYTQQCYFFSSVAYCSGLYSIGVSNLELLKPEDIEKFFGNLTFRIKHIDLWLSNPNLEETELTARHVQMIQGLQQMSELCLVNFTSKEFKGFDEKVSVHLLDLLQKKITFKTEGFEGTALRQWETLKNFNPGDHKMYIRDDSHCFSSVCDLRSRAPASPLPQSAPEPIQPTQVAPVLFSRKTKTSTKICIDQDIRTLAFKGQWKENRENQRVQKRREKFSESRQQYASMQEQARILEQARMQEQKMQAIQAQDRRQARANEGYLTPWKRKQPG